MGEEEEEEEEAAAAQAAVLTIIPVFCAMGLLGILVCNLLKKKGYQCTTSKDPQPGGTGEPRLCRGRLSVVPHPSIILPRSAHPRGFWSSLSQGDPGGGGVIPHHRVPPQLLPPGPSSIYQLEDTNEDTIGVLVRLITENKGRGGSFGGVG